jgi:hypothetical protein
MKNFLEPADRKHAFRRGNHLGILTYFAGVTLVEVTCGITPHRAAEQEQFRIYGNFHQFKAGGRAFYPEAFVHLLIRGGDGSVEVQFPGSGSIARRGNVFKGEQDSEFGPREVDRVLKDAKGRLPGFAGFKVQYQRGERLVETQHGQRGEAASLGQYGERFDLEATKDFRKFRSSKSSVSLDELPCHQYILPESQPSITMRRKRLA